MGGAVVLPAAPVLLRFLAVGGALLENGRLHLARRPRAGRRERGRALQRALGGRPVEGARRGRGEEAEGRFRLRGGPEALPHEARRLAECGLACACAPFARVLPACVASACRGVEKKRGPHGKRPLVRPSFAGREPGVGRCGKPGAQGDHDGKERRPERGVVRGAGPLGAGVLLRASPRGAKRRLPRLQKPLRRAPRPQAGIGAAAGHDDGKGERPVVGGRRVGEGHALRDGAGALPVAQGGKAPRLRDAERQAFGAARAAGERAQVVCGLEARPLQKRPAVAGKPGGAGGLRGDGFHEVACPPSLRAGDQRVGEPAGQRVAPVEQRARRQDVEGAVEGRGDGAHGEARGAVAFGVAVDAEERIAAFQEIDQVFPHARRQKRLQVRPASLLQRQHGHERQGGVPGQLLAPHAREQLRPVVRPPPQAGHPFGGSLRPKAAVGACARRGQGALRLGEEQARRVELRAVAVASRVGVACRHARGQHFLARVQKVVHGVGEACGPFRIEARHVFEHGEEGRGVQPAQARRDVAPVQVAQEAGAFPVDPEHVLEREDGVGVLAGQRAFAEAVGGNQEPRHVALAQQFGYEVGA